jgi:hypothetical protein
MMKMPIELKQSCPEQVMTGVVDSSPSDRVRHVSSVPVDCILRRRVVQVLDRVQDEQVRWGEGRNGHATANDIHGRGQKEDVLVQFHCGGRIWVRREGG